jgi:RND family efflux transporter MFP subunit
VGEAQAMLDYAHIVAPFAGQVIERRIDPGNLAAPGTPIVVLEQQGALHIEVAVDESRVADIRLGETAIVELDAIGHPEEGTVGEIVPTVEVTSRAFLVKVDLPSHLNGLRPGMFGRVGFRVGSRMRLVVPSTAVTSSGALDRVFVADKERVHLRMVTLGEKQGIGTEVLTGLIAGERIVVQPTESLRDGCRYAELP